MIRMEQGDVPAKQNREALMTLHRALPVWISTLDIQKILARGLLFTPAAASQGQKPGYPHTLSEESTT